jgi:hypothetical protein
LHAVNIEEVGVVLCEEIAERGCIKRHWGLPGKLICH